MKHPIIPDLWPMGFPPHVTIVTDPNGSYTGKPLNRKEKPVQDADDL